MYMSSNSTSIHCGFCEGGRVIVALGLCVLVQLFFTFWLQHSHGFGYYLFHRTAVLGQTIVGGWVGLLVALSMIRGWACKWVGGSVGSYVSECCIRACGCLVVLFFSGSNTFLSAIIAAPRWHTTVGGDN